MSGNTKLNARMGSIGFPSIARWLLPFLALLVAFLAAIELALSQLQTGRFEPTAGIVLLAVAVAVGIVAVAARHPVLALSLLVASSVSITVRIPTGTSSPVNLAMLAVAGLSGVWILRMLTSGSGAGLVRSPTNTPLLIFLAAVFVSWLGGYAIVNRGVVLPSNAIQVQAGQVAMFVLSAAALLLVANHRVEERTLKIWTIIIVALGVTALVGDLFRLRPHPLPAVAGSMHMWPVVFVAAHLLLNPKISSRARMVGWSIMAIWAVWAFLTPTLAFKGGWVPAAIAIFLLLTIRSWKLSIILSGAVLVVLIVTGAAQQQVLSELSSGSGYRPLIWQDILAMTASNPLLGLGPVNYMYSWPALGVDSLTLQQAMTSHPELALYWATFIRVPSHNLYVDLVAQSGIVGLATFLWFIVAAVVVARRVALGLSPGFLQTHAYAVLCGFVALAAGSFLFADWLIPFVYNVTISGFRHSVYTWLLLGSVISIYAQLNSNGVRQDG